MTVPTRALTTIGGGINRLRTKAGADSNSLYDLLNGYVTATNTVKVRKGTIRNVDLSETTGAGMTKGLVAYEGEFHIFSSSVVDVPDGYQLHVLGHPLSGSVQNQTDNYCGNVICAASNLILFPGEWESSGPAYANDGYNNHDQTGGSISVSTEIGTSGAYIGALGNVRFEGNNYVILILYGTSLTFTDLSLTLSGGSTNDYTVGTASYTPTNPPPNSNTSAQVWMWETTNTDFQTSTSTAFCINGVSYGTYVPFPITEIHFAAPYLGGIYVVAEFDVSSSSTAAEIGNIFHYWIQSSTGSDNSNTWTADTDYQIGDVVIPTDPNGLTYVASRRYPANPLWTASTAEQVGNIVEPTVANGFEYTCIATEGDSPTTGTTEPTWPTTDGATVTENSSVSNDQTVTQVTTAATTPVSTQTPSRYTTGVMA